MLTWEQICEDRRFSDLPYKIETNARGQILMSPTAYFHGKHAYRIARILESMAPEGEVIVECSVETANGVREADVAWLSLDLAAQMQEVVACPTAPELCVEVISKSNTIEEMMEKRELFLAAGAQEYWLCNKAGVMRFFDKSEELTTSVMFPNFPQILPKR